MSDLVFKILMGAIMMLFATFLVYSYANDDSCIKLNDTIEKQGLCKEANKTVKNIILYGWIAFIVPIPISLFLHHRQKQSLHSTSKELQE